MAAGQQNDSIRYGLRTMLMCVAGICVLLSVAVVILREVRIGREVIAEHHAVTQVAEMIHHYVRTQGGRFPNEWEDMRASYDFIDQSYNLGSNGLEKLQRRIEINFDALRLTADGMELQETSGTSCDWYIRVRRKRTSATLRDLERRVNVGLGRLVRRTVSWPSQKPPSE